MDFEAAQASLQHMERHTAFHEVSFDLLMIPYIAAIGWPWTCLWEQRLNTLIHSWHFYAVRKNIRFINSLKTIKFFSRRLIALKSGRLWFQIDLALDFCGLCLGHLVLHVCHVGLPPSWDWIWADGPWPDVRWHRVPCHGITHGTRFEGTLHSMVHRYHFGIRVRK